MLVVDGLVLVVVVVGGFRCTGTCSDDADDGARDLLAPTAAGAAEADPDFTLEAERVCRGEEDAAILDVVAAPEEDLIVVPTDDTEVVPDDATVVPDEDPGRRVGSLATPERGALID